MVNSVRVDEVQRLFLRHAGALRGFVTGLHPDMDAAEDLLHETFLIASRKADEFTPGSDFPAWVRAIARHKVLEHLRDRKKTPHGLSAEVIESLAESAPEGDDLLEPRREALRACLEEVSGRARQVLDLRYLDGLRPPDIACRISWKLAAVNVALSRARRFLRDCTHRKLAVTGE